MVKPFCVFIYAVPVINFVSQGITGGCHSQPQSDEVQETSSFSFSFKKKKFLLYRLLHLAELVKLQTEKNLHGWSFLELVKKEQGKGKKKRRKTASFICYSLLFFFFSTSHGCTFEPGFLYVRCFCLGNYVLINNSLATIL